MIGLGVIGLGTIFAKQREALCMLGNQYKIVALCDKDVSKGQAYGGNIPFYTSVDELLDNQAVEAVLIATPPASHVELASNILLAGKRVLLEKPAALSLEGLRFLYQSARQQDTLVHIAYHASFAVDLLWFVEEQERLLAEYNLGPLKKITCGFFDPYMIAGDFLPNKSPLGGSFIDSGVNALSVCDRLTDLSKMKMVKQTVKKKDGVVYSSTTIYTTANLDATGGSAANGTVTIELETGWNRGLNQKPHF